MLTIIFSILGIFLTICFVVGTHEFAHFQMARWCGVTVLKFSIGFGKSIITFKDKKKTEYVFALIPLGGYVQMLGEEEGELTASEKKHAYSHQPFYKKFMIVLAGPLCNFLCAIMLYWLIYSIGFVTIKPIIGQIAPQSIASRAGLQSNEQIIQIDGQETKTWMKVIFQLLTHTGDQDTLSITTIRGENPALNHYTLDLKNWKMNELTPDPFESLGFKPFEPSSPAEVKQALQTVQYHPIAAFPHALKQTYQLTYFNLILFGKMFTGKLSLDSLGGPISIFSSAGDALNSGAISFMSYLAFLSVAIGLINLFPIPGLDGGHLLLQFIETIIRRPLPQKLVFVLYRVGFALLFIVLIRAVVNDILRMM